jgi:type II secretory pathway pseudopilin PulG
MVLRICPSCGEKFEGDLCLGCPYCGARAVGPPLAKAERELPSYGRAFICAAIGVLMSAALMAVTIMALTQIRPISTRFWAIEYAGETAAWNLKWIELPLVIAVLWISTRLLRTIREAPVRFTGLWAARSGLIASGLVIAIIATLIGVTIPRRLESRRLAHDAEFYAQGYTIQRALIEYRDLHGFFPNETKDLKDVPDPDGAIAEALLNVDPNGYKPSAVVAAASTKGKSQNLRGGALRNAVTNSSADQLDHGVSFTNYELRLPGEDKVLGTDDDFIVRDGDIFKVSENSQQTTASSTRPSAP